MRERLRCGVIGAGATGLDHLHSLSTCLRASAVAVADVHPQRLREAAERFHLSRSYSDYPPLLDQPDVDAVTVAVPTHLHAEVALAALHARKHVLIETPMSLSHKEAEKLAAAAAKAQRLLLVALPLRCHRQTQMARSILQRGELGEVYHARAFWLRPSGLPRAGSWSAQRQLAGGGCLHDLGLHVLDMALHLMEDFEVASVVAHTHARFGPRSQADTDSAHDADATPNTFDVEDYAAALLKLKSGRTVALEAAWAGFQPPDMRECGLDLLGTTAGMSLFPARLYRPCPTGYETILLHLPKTPFSEDRVHHFVAAILGHEKPVVSVAESVKLQEILDALHTSAETSREVRLK